MNLCIIRFWLQLLFCLGILVSPALALKHSVTDFRLDYGSAAADTFRINPGFGDSLLLRDSIYSYKSILKRRLSDGFGDNGDAGASPIAASIGRYAFKVMYLSWKGASVHSNTNAPPGKAASRANLVVRNIEMSPDTILVQPFSTIYAGLENIPDIRFNYPSPGGPTLQNPPSPYYLNFAGEGDKFAAYWGALTQYGPVRRVTYKEPVGSGTYVPVNTPPDPPDSTGYQGTVSACLLPNTGGTKAVLVHEDVAVYPAGKFKVRWENLDSSTSVAGPVIQRPLHMPDDFGISADSAGNVLVLWRDSSELYGVAFDAARTMIMDTTKLVSGIFYGNTPNVANIHKYRPYAVANMSNGNFLIAYSRLGVVYYRKLALPILPQVYSLSNPPVPLTTLDPVAKDSCQYPDISVNADRVVIAWFQRLATDKYFFKGTIFNKQDKDIDLASDLFTNQDFAKDTISFASINPNWNFTHALKSASVAMDDKGNVVAAYDSGFSAMIALVKNTPTYYDSAIFRSKVLKVANPAIPDSAFNPSIDSVDFISMVPNDSNKVVLGLEISADSNFPGPTRNYLPLSTHRLATAGFFRYRAILHSTSPLNLTTPKLKSLDIDYNVKPRKPRVDSVKTGDSLQVAYVPGLPLPRLMPRKDSLKLVCSGFDLDDSTLTFTVSLGQVPLKSVQGVRVSPGIFRATLTFLPPDTLLDPLPLTLRVQDDQGWINQADTIPIDFKNIPPTQALTVLRNRGRDSSRVFLPSGGGMDTLFPGPLDMVVAQAGDTLTILTAYTDRNDDSLTASWRRNSEPASQAQVATRDTLRFKFPSDSLFPLVDTLAIGVGDKDASILSRILVRPNRLPSLDSLVHTAYQFSDSTWELGPFDRISNFGTDSGLVVPYELPTVLVAGISDPDLDVGDSLDVAWWTWKPREGCTPRGNLACYDATDSGRGLSFTHTFHLQEQYLTLRVIDISGAFRERKVWLEYPVADSGGNGPTGLAAIVKVLSGGDLNFILTAKIRDTTVKAQITSAGTTGLRIISVTTRANDQKWLDLKMSWLSGTPPVRDSLRFGGRTTDNPIVGGKQVLIAPKEKLDLSFTFFSDLLRGDSILVDTLWVQTNDFTNPIIKIPFRVKYYDLPVLRVGVPGTKGAGADTGYNAAGIPKFIPARSNLAFSFTETVKILEPAKVFQIYSYLDSLQNPTGYRNIAGTFSYRFKKSGLGKVSALAAVDSLADSVIFTPKYDRKSDFKQVMPSPGYFVYRDILHIRVTNAIIDKIGNPLDLRLDRNPQTAGSFDTVFTAKVDTGFFDVVETVPANGTIGWNPDQSLRIRFNRKVAQRSPIGGDTLTLLNLKALKADSNSFLKVSSVYQERGPYNFQFLALEDGDSTLVFKTRPRFPALDTVTVTLSGGILDTSGLSLDGNGNKFPDWLFDKVDSVDQFSFSFETMDQDFYVYPNPFHFYDARHVEKGSITFKNLNTLSGFEKGREVVLRVHSMTGDLIYNSHQSYLGNSGLNNGKQPYSLEWNLKAHSGATVGTGVYIYTLMTGKSKVLRKGKLAVVR